MKTLRILKIKPTNIIGDNQNIPNSLVNNINIMSDAKLIIRSGTSLIDKLEKYSSYLSVIYTKLGEKVIVPYIDLEREIKK